MDLILWYVWMELRMIPNISSICCNISINDGENTAKSHQWNSASLYGHHGSKTEWVRNLLSLSRLFIIPTYFVPPVSEGRFFFLVGMQNGMGQWIWQRSHMSWTKSDSFFINIYRKFTLISVADLAAFNIY